MSPVLAARSGQRGAVNLPLQLEDLRVQLAHAQVEAERLTIGLSDAQLWQRPPDGGWSVGDCLAHLNLAGEPYLAKMRSAVLDARTRGRTGRGPFAFGVLGGRFVRSLSAESKSKFRAPKAWQPEPQADVLGRFGRLQGALQDLVGEADGLDLGRVTVASPVSPLVRLSLFEALNLVVVHEARHLAQAGRARAALGL